MWGSVISAFSDPDSFEAAMSLEGYDGLTFTQGGCFRARLTQVSLQRLRLVYVEESLPRIAMVKVPYDMIVVGLSSTRCSPPIWGGIRPLREEMITMGASHCSHMRTEAPSHWGTIQIPVQQLSRYLEALTGKAAVSVPLTVCRWDPPRHSGDRCASFIRRPYGQRITECNRQRGKKQRVGWNSS